MWYDTAPGKKRYGKRKKEIELLRIDGVFDIETSKWDKFALGGYYDPTRGFISCRDANEFFDTLLSIGGHIWAWNGGMFDVLWFLDIANERGLKARISTAGTRLTRVEVETLTIRDAVALCPFSLADAAPIGGMELSKETGLPCNCVADCGGYCSITPGCETMPEPWIQSLTDYLELDCVATWKILENLFNHAQANNYVLKGTIGGSSWATAKRNLNLESADWKDGREYYAVRAGYYGGRVTVGRARADAGFRFDINSAYPAALSKLSLPTGERRTLAGARVSRAFDAGNEGIYCARVRVPKDCHLPPLPTRTPVGRVTFPVGRFTGSWTGLELRQAIAYGAKVERFFTATVWTETEPIFASFTQQIFDVRAKCGKKSGLGKWQKWFGNSLTGKLAQSPDNVRILINPSDEPIRCPGGICNARNRRDCRRHHSGKCCNHVCTGHCRAWKQVDKSGRIWALPFWSLGDCSHVHWAAYLTAWTRLRWLRFARQFGNRFVYGDTDSVYTTTEPFDKSDLGEGLGQWGLDGRFAPYTEDDDSDDALPSGYGFEALGPKAYRLWDPDKREWVCRLKGVQGLDNDQFELFKQGYQVKSERGVMGFRSAAKRSDSLFTRKLIKRSDLSDGVWYGDRRIIPGTDITRPVTYGEQCRRERE